MSELERVMQKFQEFHQQGRSLSVDEFFGEDKLTALPYFPHRTMYESADALRQAFDRPDELMVVDGPFGQAIIHKSQQDNLLKRALIVKQVLAEAGYTEADIPLISTEEVVALREKIQARSA